MRLPSAILGIGFCTGLTACEGQGRPLLASLIGSDDGIAFSLSPSALRVPTVRLDCRGSRAQLTLTSRSAEPLRVTETVLQDPSGVFDVDLPGLPFTLQPRESLSIPIRFEPRQPGEFEGRFSISVDRPSSRSQTVQLLGSATSDREVEEQFEQLPSLETDVVFVVDNSSSMRAEQEALRTNFQSFVEEANAGFSQYRVAVTTTDMTRERGRFSVVSPEPDEDLDGIPDDLDGDGEFTEDDVDLERGRARDRWVDRTSMPTPALAFRRLANVGAFGDATEQGMEAAVAALSPQLRSAPNAFFFRDTALLSIIFVSDEDDQSPASVAEYAEALQALAPSGRVRASAVVGPLPNGCSIGPERAAPAPRYIELVQRMGGAFTPICTDDWATTLEAVSGLAFGLRESFQLSGQPDGPLQVFVDGSERPSVLPSGTRLWSFDPQSRVLRFEPLAMPALGAQIRVRYPLACSAD